MAVSDGADDSLPDTVTVSVIENLPPVAVGEADVTNGEAPLTVNFDGSQSYDPEGGLSYLGWDFGDGAVADEASPTHTYQAPGQFIAVLTVIDDFGQSDQDSIVITVEAESAPVPVLSPVGSLVVAALLAGVSAVTLRSQRRGGPY